MNQYSPNLKPKTLHNHDDAAEKLGVPHHNVLDLRQSASSRPAQVAVEKPPALNWWQRRKQARHQAVAVAVSTIAPAAPVAAPIPETAKIQRRASQRLLRQQRRQQLPQLLRPLVAFVIVCLVLVIPFGTVAVYRHVRGIREAVLTISQEAIQHLTQGGQSASDFDFGTAATAFASAETDFQAAYDQLTSVNNVFTPVVQVLPTAGQQFTSAENVLLAGEHLAAAGQDVSRAFSILSYVDDSVYPSSITDTLVMAHSALRPAVPHLQRATLALQEVDLNSVPTEYQSAIQSAQATVPVITGSVEQLLSLSETMLTILGHDSAKRYLVLFQNNRELRPTGGFIGSFAVIDVQQGQVNSLEIPGGGPYDLLGSLKAKVISPQPLHFVNPHWQMQDANWWPDFPTSAEKVQWFYRKSGGSSVDGVITLTPDVIEQMLAITGPIAMPEYDVVIDQENFYRFTQIQAERKYDDTRESKKFIADLTPKLLDRLFALEANDLLPVLQIFYTALNEKDILIYFNDVFLQNEVRALGWSGAIEQKQRDYLMVVDTNISGGKTDAIITETIEHQAAIQTDGSVIDTVTVTRTHQGQSGDVFEDVNNVDYIRLYVPADSELLSASGFTQPDPKLRLEVEAGYELDEDLQRISGDTLIDESTNTRINQEFGKTVFGNWIETRPGETSRVTIQYRLPFRIATSSLLQPADSYSIFIQKQPGSFDPLLLTSLTYPKSYQVRWAYPATALNTTLRHDLYVGVVLEQ